MYYYFVLLHTSTTYLYNWTRLVCSLMSLLVSFDIKRFITKVLEELKFYLLSSSDIQRQFKIFIIFKWAMICEFLPRQSVAVRNLPTSTSASKECSTALVLSAMAKDLAQIDH